MKDNFWDFAMNYLKFDHYVVEGINRNIILQILDSSGVFLMERL